MERNERSSFRRSMNLLLLLACASCFNRESMLQTNFFNENASVTGPLLSITGGNNQSNYVGLTLSGLAITAKTADQLAYTNQQIDWTSTGGCTLTSATTTTDSNGSTSNSLTLPSVAGNCSITATLHGTSASVTFTETVINYSTVSNGLLVNFDAAYASGGNSAYSAGCTAGQLTWTDQKSGIVGTLVNFGTCDSTVGWNGSGTSVDPYRLNLDHTNAAVDLGTPASFPTGFSPRTICTWAKLDSVTGGFEVAVSLGPSSFGHAMYIGTDSGADLLNGGGYADNVYSPSSFWTLGVWRHACLTYDGTTAKIYGNATLLTSQAMSWDLQSSNAYIGASPGSPSANEGWYGAVASFVVYNRVLTATEVWTNCMALKNRFSGVVCN